MIFGIGTDLVDMERIRAMKSTTAFAKKILGPQELAQYEQMSLDQGISYLGMQFAAKEAIAKAFGSGFSSPIFPQAIQVLRNKFGKPEILFSQEVKSYAEGLGIKGSHVSLSDERNHLIAFAVLEV
jgi:holo-[acyl-carrier protein] synthase|tara:strand:- start:671 stop:1048 length:378 start_codon:yes stop_codon:yes gene_type:complete